MIHLTLEIAYATYWQITTDSETGPCIEIGKIINSIYELVYAQTGHTKIHIV